MDMLETAKMDRSLLATVKQYKYSDHILKSQVIVWKSTVPGSCAHGRPKTAWIDNITSWSTTTPVIGSHKGLGSLENDHPQRDQPLEQGQLTMMTSE